MCLQINSVSILIQEPMKHNIYNVQTSPLKAVGQD